MTITEQLRALVNGDAQTRYAIHKATKIDQAALMRFADGGDAKGTTLDKLAEYFKLELRPTRGRKK